MKHTVMCTAAGLALAAALSLTPARAQNARSFVSGHGLDTNACTFTAPCRTFAAAFSHTNPGGEIDALDPAGYGSLTITHAISIVNDGVGTVGALAPSGGVAITISAGASDAVNLRGLTIEGAGAGLHGIQFNTGKALTIQNSVVRNFTHHGIAFFPNQSTASSLAVKETYFANNGSIGIFVQPLGSGAVTAIFNRVDADNNAVDGIALLTGAGLGKITATAVDCVVSNSLVAFQADSPSVPSPASLTVIDSVAANGGTGLFADGAGATIRVSRTTVTGNTNGWVAENSSAVKSYGDNNIDGNAGNQTAPPPVAQK